MTDTGVADRAGSPPSELAAGQAVKDMTGSVWTKMAHAMASEQRVMSEPILSQDEIDDLIRGGLSSQISNQNVEALAEPRSTSINGLPFLKSVADVLVQTLAQDIRQLTSSIVGAELVDLSCVRMGSFIDSIPLPSLLAIIKSDLWPGFGLISVDHQFASVFLDILMGGRQSRSGTVKMSRPFSVIEQKFFRRLADVSTICLSAAFNQTVPTSFVLDRIETNPRLAVISAASELAARIRIHVQFGSRSGHIEFILPFSTLEPIATALRPAPIHDTSVVDPVWRGHLVSRVGQFDAEIDVVLREFKLPFRVVAGLSVGDTIPLDMRPDTPVLVRCRGLPISAGMMGRSGDHVAISLTEQPGNRKNRERG